MIMEKHLHSDVQKVFKFFCYLLVSQRHLGMYSILLMVLLVCPEAVVTVT